MDDQICEAVAAETLQAQVNQQIREGWRPWGGLSVADWTVCGSTVGIKFYQAMIREVPPPRPIPPVASNQS